ncbi:MAG: hypothetical protein EOO49_12745 [Flavobacterium sp.]|nr:MAG: hypothetical protein EOO49_12745 [Flavobacterium sp.]
MFDKKTFTENYRSLIHFDVRMELLFDALLHQGVDPADVNIIHKSLFYRKFSKDVTLVQQDRNDPDALEITVSRDGIYDILPQSITHDYSGRDVREDPVQDFKSRKKEEKQARDFFSPLENEFFLFRHEIETFEARFLSGLNTNGVADIIKSILGIEKEMPDHLVIKLFYALMLQKSKPVNDTVELCRILSEIIGESVSFTSDNIILENNFDIEDKQQEMIMGINTTLASSEKIFLKKYHFRIGPLSKPSNLPLYFTGEELENFLNAFFNLFIPFHSQFSFEISLNPEDELFSMDDELIYKSRLGISTVL